MDYLSRINQAEASREERLAALKAFLEENWAWKDGYGRKPKPSGEINNHIHTIYSFSPYTPSMAALKAVEAGLEAAGSVDHDSIGAAQEMMEACALLGIGGCSGFELRVSFMEEPDGKPSGFRERKINNPDSPGLAYMTVQGIPSSRVQQVRDFLAPIHRERNKRNLRMLEKINRVLDRTGFENIDYDHDVLARSKAAEGGSVTERHLMAAVARKLIHRYGMGPALVSGLVSTLKIKPKETLVTRLGETDNPHYLFDLLGVLKTDFLPRYFIQPNEEESISAERVVSFALSIGAIPAYAYLGDVGNSPTGDKGTEKFEDAYLEELFDYLDRIGFKAVTYMPPRNTEKQLRRVQGLCADRGFMQISGVDINSSRQSFRCPEVLRPEFRHLIDTTWALVAHERLASINGKYGLFSPDNPLGAQALEQRLRVYAALGKDMNKYRPAESAARAADGLEKGVYGS